MIDLDLLLAPKESGYHAEIKLNGDFDSAQIASEVNPRYIKLTSGNIPGKQVDLQFPTDGEFAYAVSLDANLMSSEWYLPHHLPMPEVDALTYWRYQIQSGRNSVR